MYQQDQLQSHRHFKSFDNRWDINYVNPLGDRSLDALGLHIRILDNTVTGVPTNSTGEPAIRIGTETKPASLSALYCISY
jgi:hypothetical protein